ncbi:MAG: sulfur globule family protein [Bacteroidetes bacterium]|nr:sulfur globule family protein [Bacteroidota bacterium]
MKFVILVFLSFNLSAQISQPARYEHAHKNNDHEFIIISMGEQGLALMRDIEKYENGKKDWEVIFLDSALQEIWSTKIAVQQRMNILGHEYRDGNVYLVFQEPESAGRSVGIFELNLRDQLFKEHLFKPELSIHFTQFSVLKTKAIFGGYINKEPALLQYDLNEEKARIIPGVFQPNVDLVDVRVNSNETFNMLLVEGRSNKSKKLIARTFDANGVMLVEDAIAIEEGKTVLEAISSSLIRDELIIIGTWTYGSTKQAAGIFSVVVDPFHEQKVNYYDFALLNHFLDYFKPKRAAKIKAKADWRRSVGKPPEFRAYLSGIKIEETKDGFSFLGEVYEASYYNSRNSYPYGSNPYYSNPYGFYPYGFSPMPYRYYNNPYYPTPYGSPAQVAEIRMISSSLLFFDTQGKLVSDQSLKFPEIKLSSKEQISDFITHNGFTTMVSKDEKEIQVKVNEKDGTTVKEEKVKPELKNPNETIRSESDDNTGIRAWFGQYFYVYGYQAVRDNVKKTSHDVFYINKVKVD